MATGFKAMQQAVKNASQSKQGSGRRFDYFSLEDGESIIIRFITDEDEIITTNFYEYVQIVQDGKEGTNSFIVAPDYYAEDPTWVGEDWVRKYGGMTKEWGAAELTPPKPKERTVAIAVEREEVAVENPDGGRPKFRYQDKLITVTDKDGKEYTGRRFILIRQPAKTFWKQPVGYYGEYQTLCDRDYKITRQGKQLATDYLVTPKGEDPEWNANSLKELQARYGYGTGKDMDGKDLADDSPDRFLYCPQTLAEWAADQASEDRAKALLSGSASTPRAAAQTRHNGSSGNDEFHKDTTSNPADAPDEAQAAPPPAAGDVSALRARLEAHK